jgi:hypothetical protein
MFRRLKGFRGIGTRYDKPELGFCAALCHKGHDCPAPANLRFKLSLQSKKPPCGRFFDVLKREA